MLSEKKTDYKSSVTARSIELVNRATLKIQALGFSGPVNPEKPGLDACEWRRILTHFNQTSIELCKTIAKLSHTIASKVLPHENITAYNSCRLIPLDKNSTVRPIDMGEVPRRIIGKTITQCIKSDLKKIGKNFQLCLGQKRGIEYAIHSLRNEFRKPETDAILLIDAEIAFNSRSIENVI